jgi:hypothetical protein
MSMNERINLIFIQIKKNGLTWDPCERINLRSIQKMINLGSIQKRINLGSKST